MKKAKSFIEEFKKFIARGNVIDLAVGVIIGGAFTSIVNSLVKDIFMPFVGMLVWRHRFYRIALHHYPGNRNHSRGCYLLWQLHSKCSEFYFGSICVFIIIKIINRFQKKKPEAPAVPKVSEEVLLLQEIRDLLKEKQ